MANLTGMRALLLGLLTACASLPPAPAYGDDDAAPPPAGSAGVAGAPMAGTSGDMSTPPVAGTGGVVAEAGKTGAAGAAQNGGRAGQGVAGESSAGMKDDGGAAEEPECCSGSYNGIGQCIITGPACAGAGGMPPAGTGGSSTSECKCGLWSCPAPCTPNAWGECTNPSVNFLNGCAIGSDDYAGCTLTAPSC